MKRYSYFLWLILVLILIAIGMMLKIIIHNGESKNSSTQVPDQMNSGGQEALKRMKSIKSVPNFNVLQLSMSEWNTTSGIPYVQVPGANLGATSFMIIDKNRIAFLCNSTNEIIITSISTGKSIQRFQVSFAPRDFVYEKGIYYVLFEHNVISYNENGKELTKYPFPAEYQGVEKIIRNNDATYLLLPSGNCLKIEYRGKPVEPVEYNGIITETGQYITTQITGNNSYSLKIQDSEKRTFEKTFTTDKKVAGVFVTGATDNRIILDVQTFISENPISVERTVTSVDLNKKGIGTFVNSSEVPDCYYIISNKDFYLSENGNIYNMITTPKGVLVFLLTETKSDKAEGYPSSLAETKYHSNDNLIKLD